MTKIKVDVAQLIAKANELETLNEQFHSAVENLNTTESLLFSEWDGDANTEFHKAFTNDTVQMTNFYNAIAVYIMRLRNIIHRYQVAELKNADTGRERKY